MAIAANPLQIVDTVCKLFELSAKLLELLAIGLEIEDSLSSKGEKWFASNDPTKESCTTFRLLHYPGQRALHPESLTRAGAHTDYGSMTMLFQRKGQEGLEIYSISEKKWHPVPYVPANGHKIPRSAPPIIVNIGDLLEYWKQVY
ncbi:uncharacterized protein RJT20DRAFT_147971 [Scheffersomyces xylosifermentans]|uniref:uncharacterized protein n=1 Tax=Scheffersomyces xylosifermentans TaxID=1304137 RepID=UPI00315D89D5